MRLRLAEEHERLMRDRLCHSAWGGELTVAAFLEREQILRTHPFGERLLSWLLVEGDQILASCETYRLGSVLDGQRGATYGIASVFTDMPLRGRGYATAMMRLLGDEIERRDPDTQALVLFSEVGAQIYARVGFVACEGEELVLDVEPGDPAEGVDLLFTEQEALGVFRGLSAPHARFVLWPSIEQLDWHFERERLHGRLLGRSRPPFVGGQAGGSLAIFTADLKARRLRALLRKTARPEEERTLLRMAQRIAHGAGLAAVHVWLVGDEIPPAVGRRQPRSDALPMIRPLRSFSPDEWRHIPRVLWL